MSFQTILFHDPQLFTLIGLKVDGLEICMSSNIWSCCGGSKKVSGLFSFYYSTMTWIDLKQSDQNYCLCFSIILCFVLKILLEKQINPCWGITPNRGCLQAPCYRSKKVFQNHVRYSILAPTSFNSVKISVKKLGSELMRSMEVLRRLTIFTQRSQNRSLSDSTKNGFNG